MTKKETDTRRRELAAIHIAKAKLSLDDEAYRIILWNHFGYESAKDLSARERRVLLAILGNLQAGKPAPQKCLSSGLKTRLYEAFKATPEISHLMKFSSYIVGRTVENLDDLTDAEARHVLAAIGGYHR